MIPLFNSQIHNFHSQAEDLMIQTKLTGYQQYSAIQQPDNTRKCKPTKRKEKDTKISKEKGKGTCKLECL